MVSKEDFVLFMEIDWERIMIQEENKMREEENKL